MTQINEAEARIIEAIMSETANGSHSASELRALVREAFAHFKERSEMRAGELEAKLELSEVRNAQRKAALMTEHSENKALRDQLNDARKVIELQEQRERDLEARAEAAEGLEADNHGCATLVRFVKNCSMHSGLAMRQNAWKDHADWYDVAMLGEQGLTAPEVDLVRALLDD